MEILNDFSTSVKKAFAEIDTEWENYDGLVVAGTHTPHDVSNTLEKIRLARETSRPFLGICFGLQLMAIEYARNVLGIKDATSEEWGKGTFVVTKRPELKVGHQGDGTYWNNYEVNIKWEKPINFFTSQFHPEYESSKKKPHPLLVEFLNFSQSYE